MIPDESKQRVRRDVAMIFAKALLQSRDPALDSLATFRRDIDDEPAPNLFPVSIDPGADVKRQIESGEGFPLPLSP